MDTKSGGNARISEANGLNLSGTTTGGSGLELLDAGTTILAGNLLAPAATVTVGGEIVNPGFFTINADTLKLTGNGNAGNLLNPLLTTVNQLALSKSAGNTVVYNSAGISLSGSTAGDLWVSADGTISQSDALTVQGNANFSAPGATSDVLLGDFANHFAAVSVALARDVALRYANPPPVFPPSLPATLGNLTLIYDAAPITLSATFPALTGTLKVQAQGITLASDITAPNVAFTTTTLDLLGFNITAFDGFNYGAVTLENSQAATGTGQIRANTLTLIGAGDVGQGGSPLNTTVQNINLNKTGGATYLSQTGPATLQGTDTGPSLNLSIAGGDLTVGSLSGALALTLDIGLKPCSLLHPARGQRDAAGQRDDQRTGLCQGRLQHHHRRWPDL